MKHVVKLFRLQSFNVTTPYNSLINSLLYRLNSQTKNIRCGIGDFFSSLPWVLFYYLNKLRIISQFQNARKDMLLNRVKAAGKHWVYNMYVIFK